jgi:hypothetical protein
MTTATKTLLAVSLTAFAIGCTDVLGGVGSPLCAVFFGLFMISRILEKEAALFDEEQRSRVAWANRNEVFALSRPCHIEEDVREASQFGARAHSS